MEANFFSFSEAISLFRKNLPNSFGTGVMGTARVDRRTCDDSLQGSGRRGKGIEKKYVYCFRDEMVCVHACVCVCMCACMRALVSDIAGELR